MPPIPPFSQFLVTGGAGFIGSHLVEALLARGMSVRVIDNFSTGNRENLAPFMQSIELIEGSIADPQACRRACKGVDFVLHEAAIPSVPRSVRDPVESHEASVTGTLHLLEAARAAKVRRVVYAASSSAYGEAARESKGEDLLPMPLSPYAAMKLACEYYLSAWHNVYGLETVSIRYFNVFGPRQDPASEYSAVIPKFITRMLRGERPTIYGGGEQSRDFTHVSNIVDGCLRACVAPAANGRVMNVACGQRYSLLYLVTAINKIIGKNIQPIFEPARAGDVKHSLADIKLARELLGYEPAVSFEDGLRKTIEWYRARV